MGVSYLQGPALLVAVNTILTGLSFPTSATYPDTVGIWYCGTSAVDNKEQVRLYGDIEPYPVDWENSGRIQEERLAIRMEVRTHVPGITWPNALARADVLSRVVQDGFRDSTTGLPKGAALTTIAGTGVLLSSWRFDETGVEAVQLGNEGWGCNIPLQLRLITRR